METIKTKHKKRFRKNSTFVKWVFDNCEHCVKGYKDCTIQLSLFAAQMSDGYVSTEIIERMGEGSICKEQIIIKERIRK